MAMARFSLLTKLLLAVLVPTVLTFAGFAILGHFAAARALEAELGRRLGGVAAVAAAQIGEESVALLAPGDEESRTYRNLRRKLVEVRDAAGVARVYLFAADLSSRVDSDEVPIGTRYYSLESSRAELRQVFVEPGSRRDSRAVGAARPVSSLLFRGRDGRLYKSGYAPISGSDGAVRFAVGVDGNAALYADLLGLRKTLLFVGSGGVLAMVLLAVLLGLRLVGPLQRLKHSARLIGSGDLDRPVVEAKPRDDGRSSDEVAELAQGLEAMRQGLRARDERMQMMLSGIAHEVRNPLGGMELFAGLLAEELEAAQTAAATATTGGFDVPTSAGYVKRIQKELRHLQAVVQDFLEYARRTRPELRETAVADLLGEVAESVAADAPPTVQVVVEPPAQPLYVAADATQLRRVLLNLAHNAVQACAAVPADDARLRQVRLSISLRADEKREQVRIVIADSGLGIPDEVLPKIWTPFFTTRAQGTGLGLAFVREIVTDHAGTIEVKTGADGTRFELILPSAREPSPARR